MTLAASAVPSISHSTEAGTETGTEAGTETGTEDTGETAEGAEEGGESGAAGQTPHYVILDVPAVTHRNFHLALLIHQINRSYRVIAMIVNGLPMSLKGVSFAIIGSVALNQCTMN